MHVLCIFIKFRSIYCLCSMVILSLFHVHGDSIVRSRRPVVTPVQCPPPKAMPPHWPPKLRVPEPPLLDCKKILFKLWIHFIMLCAVSHNYYMASLWPRKVRDSCYGLISADVTVNRRVCPCQVHAGLHLTPPPLLLPSAKQHPSYGDCLQV